MPRNHVPGASTLRNRNRITNKTRLKIIRGNVDADDLLIPDEDEEKHRLTNLVAGVDAEDANEHHLQEVLSAAHRGSSAATKKATAAAATDDKPSAYIPTPDSTGVAENWEQLYPSNVWKDPATFVCTSTPVEESVRDGLANGFSYFMDERDKEWLDKNNEEARGEGTSAQGAISASGTRTSARSAKAKGKEPELSQPVVITEDEFELVMGLFEKVTHEKTEFLHHSLETGMPFPAFSEYQDTFSTPLTPAIFATYSVPSWIPQPQHLLRIARAVYPYWKERRIERSGHRIIPTLNFDESDTLNESYICFRRREIKAVRKTRQAQVTSSDKLVRLQQEFAYPLELARHVLQRETLKREQAVQAQQVWDRRLALVDLKRKFGAFADKSDEDLLVDKERPAKRAEPSRLGVKIPANAINLVPVRPEPIIKPRERIAQVRERTEALLAKRKEDDKIWEDVIDNPQQVPYTPYSSKLFKFIPPSSAPSSDGSDKTADSDDERANAQRALRIRYARNNTLRFDRSSNAKPLVLKLPRSSLFAKPEEDDESEEERWSADRLARDRERWRSDADDEPQSLTAEDDCRVLVDDADTKYLQYRMGLLSDIDHNVLQTDQQLYLPTADGRQQVVVPYRLGPPPVPRITRPPPQMLGNGQPGVPQQMQAAPHAAMPLSMPMAQVYKKMPPPTGVPQQRISANGGMRAPGVPPSPGIQASASGGSQTPPQPVALPATQHAPINGANGAGRAAIAMPHVDMVKPPEQTMINGAATASVVPTSETASTPAPQETLSAATAVSAPPRPKSSNQQLPMAIATNGYHVPSGTPTSAAQSAFVPANFPQLQAGPNGLALLAKSVYANIPASQQLAAMQAAHRGNYAQGFPGVAGMNLQQMQNAAAMGNLNMKLPNGVRGMQWAAAAAANLGAAGMARPASAAAGEGAGAGGANGLNIGVGAGSPSPNQLAVPATTAAHLVPVRSASANGMRAGMRIPSSGGMPGQAPQQQHVVGAMSPGLAASLQQQQQQQVGGGGQGSPGRLGGVVVNGMTPGGMGMAASPPIQHSQAIGNQNGY